MDNRRLARVLFHTFILAVTEFMVEHYTLPIEWEAISDNKLKQVNGDGETTLFALNIWVTNLRKF